VVIRAGLFFYNHNLDQCIWTDTSSYERPALSLLQEGRFLEDPDIQGFFAKTFGSAPPTEPKPMFVRTPGFPLFIAAVYGLGGHRSALIMVQILISGIGIWFTYLLGRALFSEAAGALGALVMAIDPLATWFTQVILSDTVFATMFLGCMLLAVAFLRRPNWRLAAGFGTALAAATLVRPVAYYLPVPLCVVFWFGRVPKRMILGALAPVLLIVGGWQQRNLATVGTAEFSGIEGINLLAYRAASIVAWQEHVSLWSAQKQLIRSLPDPASLSGPEMNRAYTAAALKIIAAHEAYYLHDVARGIAVLAFGPGGNHSGLPDIVFNRCYTGFLLLLYALIGYEAWASRRTAESVLHGMMALMAAYIFLVSAGADTVDRYRLPAMPIIAVYAGAGAIRACRQLARRRADTDLRRPRRWPGAPDSGRRTSCRRSAIASAHTATSGWTARAASSSTRSGWTSGDPVAGIQGQASAHGRGRRSHGREDLQCARS
jgi:4-amino-4-deoxy-L-arabinose transferase-like glycosyltransferase